jgi:hypothetical protein
VTVAVVIGELVVIKVLVINIKEVVEVKGVLLVIVLVRVEVVSTVTCEVPKATVSNVVESTL